MASHPEAPSADASPAGFGAWLRARREAKGGILRTTAAKVNMDPSHLGKAERGNRLPTWEQATSLAHALGIDLTEMRSRFAAAKLWRECGGDAAIAAGAASLVQEHAGSYVVNKSGNIRPNKK